MNRTLNVNSTQKHCAGFGKSVKSDKQTYHPTLLGRGEKEIEVNKKWKRI